MQLSINDYNFDSASANQGWAQVEIFGKVVEFNFLCYDAVTAAIELGIIEQPDDRDQVRIGYENPAFSATVRKLLASDSRVLYQQNNHVLSDFYTTEFGLEIVFRLTLQSPEVKEVIQVEAERIALHECPARWVQEPEIRSWFVTNYPEMVWDFISFKEISHRKKQLWYEAEEETLSQL